MKEKSSKIAAGYSGSQLQPYRQTVSGNAGLFNVTHRSGNNIKLPELSIPRLTGAKSVEKTISMQNLTSTNTKTTMSYTSAIMTAGRTSKKNEGFSKQTCTKKHLDIPFSLQSTGYNADINSNKKCNRHFFSEASTPSFFFEQNDSLNYFDNENSLSTLQKKSEHLNDISLLEKQVSVEDFKYDVTNTADIRDSILDQLNLQQNIKNSTSTIKLNNSLSIPSGVMQPEYSLFDDTFNKATHQSMWNRESVCKKNVNFASIAGSGTTTNCTANSMNCYLDIENSIADLSKAPGYRGNMMQQYFINKNKDSKEDSIYKSADTTEHDAAVFTNIYFDSQKCKIPIDNLHSNRTSSFSLNTPHTFPSAERNSSSDTNYNQHSSEVCKTQEMSELSIGDDAKNDPRISNIVHYQRSAPSSSISNQQTHIYQSSLLPSTIIPTTMSRLNPQAPDFNSSHFSENPQSLIHDQITLPSSSIQQEKASSHSTLDFNKCHTTQTAQAESICQARWAIKSTNKLSTNCKTILSPTNISVCFSNSPKEDSHEGSQEMKSNYASEVMSPTSNQVSSERHADDRKTPRPIGTERSWKNQLTQQTSCSDIETVTWSFVKENNVHSWSDFPTNPDRDKIYNSKTSYSPIPITESESNDMINRYQVS